MIQFEAYRYDLTDFMDDIRRNPFLRITLPLLFGIIFQYYLFPVQISGLAFIAVFFGSLFILQIFKVYQQYSFAWLYGFHYYLIFFFMGISLVQLNPLKTTIPLNEENCFELLVAENPVHNDNSLRLDVKIRAFSADGENWKKCNELSIIYMEKDSTLRFSPGDVLVCKTVFNEFSPPQNPGEFDYREYLRRKKIFATAFVNSNKVVVVDSGQINFYRKFIFNLQQYSLETLQKAQLKSDELAVAMALLIGDKQFLEDDLRSSYTNSGTVHLLAVSGLHVGIVFMILSFVLKFMDRKKKLRLIKGFIILISLWIFASVAGLASSIVRASVMFSIFIVADMTGKSKSTYNNMALSCFIMCLANPYVIFESGFQLSYLAVLGIVYFQPKFMKPFHRCNRFVKPLVECMTVTVAAQLGTLPVILYIFKTFPTYFLLSNLILVPYTSVVMYIGALVIALSWQPFLLVISGAVLNVSIYLMNWTVKFFDQLPGSTIDGINIDGIQCTLLVVSILSLALLFSFKRRICFVAIMASMIGLFSIGAFHSYKAFSHKEFGVFGVKRAFYAYFIENGEGFSIRDTVAINKSFDFNTKNYLISRGFRSEQDLTNLSLADSIPDLYKGVLLFSGKKIALSSQLAVTDSFSGTPLNVDYLFVTERQNIKPETMLSCYNPAKIIIANNLPASKITEWLELAESRKIPCHNIKTEGGFREFPSVPRQK
ncbi:MAG: competence protein ComEC family protein [Dysgonamonadaceae bacterium]|jgi:competence protein ComEC|nr:competence protein ComEC family protein [Dysgonamonadaceae bacterium]